MKKVIYYTVAIIFVLFLQAVNANAQLTKLVVSLTGSIFNEITKDPVSVHLEAFDDTGKRIYRGKSNAAQNGYYYMTGLKPGSKYTILIADFDYFKQEFEITIPNTEKYAEFSRDLLVKPKEKGMQIPFKVPPFELNKSKLRAGSDYFLADILTTLQKNPRVKFQLLVYPDNDNNSKDNKTLTDERCKSLKDYFTKNGVQEDRITMMGNDRTDPKNPPPTKKRAKGKRYIGSIYLVVDSF